MGAGVGFVDQPAGLVKYLNGKRVLGAAWRTHMNLVFLCSLYAAMSRGRVAGLDRAVCVRADDV